jgi:hypothetical protein
MSFVSVTPDVVGQAAGELDSIGSALSAAHAAAAASTTGIVAPGADAVSAAVAALLGTHAEEYQAVGAQAADFHSQFVSLLNAGTGSYVSTELANARSAAAFGGGPITLRLNGTDRTGHAVATRDDQGQVTVTVKLDDR